MKTWNDRWSTKIVAMMLLIFSSACNSNKEQKTQDDAISMEMVSEVEEAKIHEKIASVGHDTEKVKATDKAYNSLPGCCKYERNI